MPAGGFAATGAAFAANFINRLSLNGFAAPLAPALRTGLAPAAFLVAGFGCAFVVALLLGWGAPYHALAVAALLAVQLLLMLPVRWLEGVVVTLFR